MDINKIQNSKEKMRKDIITLFGIDKLEGKEKEEMIAKIGNLIFQAVLMRVLPLLAENDLTEYDKLVESNPAPDVLLDFFFEKIPNFLEIMAEESENFRKDAEGALK